MLTRLVAHHRRLFRFRRAVLARLEADHGEDVAAEATRLLVGRGKPDFRDIADAEGIEPTVANADRVADAAADYLT